LLDVLYFSFVKILLDELDGLGTYTTGEVNLDGFDADILGTRGHFVELSDGH
jgi:hypothetical protein